ncbi:MAG: hypothetical protein ACRCVG_04050 [Methanobacteriaceae archaeon]
MKENNVLFVDNGVNIFIKNGYTIRVELLDMVKLSIEKDSKKNSFTLHMDDDFNKREINELDLVTAGFNEGEIECIHTAISILNKKYPYEYFYE